MSEFTLIAPIAGWAMPLTEVADPAFAQGMVGQGLAIEPTGDTLHSPCDGQVLTIHAARHAITLCDANGVELLMHIGIDSVALGRDGFTALVAPGDRVKTGDPLIRFDLDLLVMRAQAATTPIIVAGDGVTIVERFTDRLVAVGDPLMRLLVETSGDTTTASGERHSRDVTVALDHGLHARPAGRIVAALRALDASANLRTGEHTASAASSIALLGLGLSHGSAVTIDAEGPDAAVALDAIAAVLTTPEANAAPPPPVARPVVTLPDGAIAGVCAAPGLALGTARWLRRARPVPLASTGAVAERAALYRGIAAVEAQLAADASGHGQAAGVFAAHREILADPTLRTAAIARVQAGDSAAAAILATTDDQAATLRASADARIAERADDLVDVGERVAHAILGTSDAMPSLAAGTILLAGDLLPSHFAALDAASIAGIALVRGGPTAHVAILSAGAGIPMVVALRNALEDVADDTPMLLDGDAGYVLASPSADVITAARATIDRRTAAEARARALGDAAVTTTDGTAIAVQANCGSAADAATAQAAGADGCGLLRTEFLFLDRATAPDRAEQRCAYAAVMSALPGKPVTIRLLDVGGDKPAPYLDLPAEENPALGLRGVRVSLARPDVLDAQLTAILSLPDLAHARIMVPMVASADELAAVRAALTRLAPGTHIQLGAMIETPAAAIGADLIARHADFLSIGSNDLAQYTLAADRGNASVAAMLDGLHPAVLRLIAETCTRAGSTPVSVCGGLAADPLAAPILIGLGVRTLSVPPGRIAATKALVTAHALFALRTHAQQALALASAAEVRALARRFAEENAA
ncbi:phosphocarrier protein [Sphingomonas jinjuensis]|uniref:phosphoenolpyruvate--protein phosphotransferase n=1 Tax=Sphingomonas jinjuensis TaxID=535907 RepID=A0A840FB83_9SPHN|nr:phosphoenolpyruvate--protein phosphotransferase [Sphingomonas jinjuensis]MBB4153921.1 phosphocarrier protein [Sphingomonas jinjuensis]